MLAGNSAQLLAHYLLLALWLARAVRARQLAILGIMHEVGQSLLKVRSCISGPFLATIFAGEWIFPREVIC